MNDATQPELGKATIVISDRQDGRVAAYGVSCTEHGDLTRAEPFPNSRLAVRYATTHGQKDHGGQVNYQVPPKMTRGRRRR